MSMSTDMWTYREDTVAPGDAPRNVVGHGVEATDGSIGKVDDATYEVGSSHLVVDTGPWIFGKKVMLPAGVIQSVDHEAEKIMVDRSKDEIKNAPELDEATSDVGASYIVVDTGPWIFGKKVMLPAGVIESVDHDAEKIMVDRSKDEIKRAPELEDTMLEDEGYRMRLGSYYDDSSR